FAQTLSQAPSPVLLSSAFTPALVRGIRIHPNNPFQFDFIIDSGDTGLKTDALKEESEKLIRYFLASLTLPENDLWVNLSPYEKDRIVPNELGQTEMGIDMLSQDYLLKQITASLTNPESDIGKDFWSRVYKLSYEKFGTTNIPVDTFNKVWIMPDKATVYVQEDKAFIVESRLKVMLEEDYVAKEKGLEGQRIIGAEESQKSEVKSQSATQQPNEPDKLSNPLTLKSSSPVSTLSSSIVREVFIPVLEKEVNEGKNFAQLRQIYNSIILSHWYKTNLKNSILNKVYSDQKKIEGLKGQRNKGIKESQNSKGKIQNETQQPNEPDKLSNPLTLKSSDLQSEVQIIYQQYLDTFKQGVCNMMKVEYDPYARKNIPRKYFAGGVDITSFGKGAGHAYRETNNKTACSAIFNRLHKTALAMLVTFDLLASSGNTFADAKSVHPKMTPSFTSEYFLKDLQTSLFQRFQDSSAPIDATAVGSPKERSLNEKDFYADMVERFDLSTETVMAANKLLSIGFKNFRSTTNTVPAWKVLSLDREPQMTHAIVQEDFEEFYFYVLDRFGLDPRSRWFEDVFGACELYAEFQKSPGQKELFESDQFTNTLNYLRDEFLYVFVGPQVALQVLDLSRNFDSKAMDDLRQEFSQQYPKEKIRINDLFLLEYIRHNNELFPLLFDRKALEQRVLETIYQQPVEVREDDDVYYSQERKDPASIDQYPTLFL
ncbi:MAG TPA: hypothetical protein PLO93_05795, partial [Candidatus Omnitrophota bacterium]|nr:hypothetical protein [Candidatus Omnitrophota bacterium]